MRSLIYILLFVSCGTLAFAQPANDNCSGLIDLGEVPTCLPTVYTNIGATASNIGFGNNPSCFNGGSAQRDVWFAFTTTTDIVNVTISLIGVPNGPNGQSILNPQIALYRGDCVVDGLAELACISAPNGDAQIDLDVLGLTPGLTYFLRVNDYSATATPNAGDFTLCVQEYVPAINIGDEPGTTACFGSLYDSGGPDGDYGDNENETFTICPNDFHQCIEINVLDFQMETNFDHLRFFAGNDVSAPLIADLTGPSNGQPFIIQASSGCVTVQFTSDGSAVQEGFELEWTCSPLACDGSSIDNPTVINSVPFTQNGLSTCDAAATFANSPCGNDAFLNGPEYVFAYNSPGGLCASINITGALGGTGVIVLDGPPSDPGTSCIATSPTGSIGAANFQQPGLYYIVVANAAGCTSFNINIQPAECLLAPGLASALCNPLNGCIQAGGVPSIFQFENGFQDMDIVAGVNDGCWLGVGAEPDFYWFTIQAQAAGPFGFVLQSADNPSDIDFSVWGPFTQQQVCETPQQVISFISSHQPTRSSWAAGADPTGLADIHPVLNTPVTDTYDCGGAPGAGGDDFVSTIATQEGEVYVVLVNDFGNQIANGGISVNWNPSAPEVLSAIPTEITGGDTTVCVGESVQLGLSSAVDNIEWIEETSTLSCTNCPNPIATPTETTIYKAIIDAVCYNDTVKVEVVVFDVKAGPDRTVCLGENFEVNAGDEYEQATYSWNSPSGLQLSCPDCPNPTVTASGAGTFNLIVTLTTPNCVLQDTAVIAVLPQQAPQVIVNDDQEICIGTTVSLGGAGSPGVTYSWVSDPVGFISANPNPSATPNETTTYYLTATNNSCPLPTLDSVTVAVYTNPVLSVSPDTAVCQGSPIVLGTTTIEPNTIYEWTGPEEIADPTNPNTTALPQSEGTYVLTATRGACVVTEEVNVTITPIAIDLIQEDTMLICRGTSVNLEALITPPGAQTTWTPNDGSLNTNSGTNVVATPQSITTYTATVSVPGCIKTDAITIVVDSLPAGLAVMPSDTMVCEGSIVLLQTPVFEPSDFPNISFLWRPTEGQQSPDTLFNLVVTPDTTTDYYRISINGVCIDTSYTHVKVTPFPQVLLTPGDTILCQGQALQLNAAFTPVVDEIKWEPAVGLSCEDCANPVATPGESTTYTVTGKIDNCPTSASVSIEVVKPPTISVPQTTEICQGETTDPLLLSQPDPEVTYTWTSPEIPGFISNDPLLSVSPASTTTYMLSAMNECFTRNAQVTVFVVQDATVDVGDATICAGDPLNLSADGTAPDGVSEFYSWNINGTTLTGPSISVNGLSSNFEGYLTYVYGPNCGSVVDTFNVTVLGGEFSVGLTVSPADSLLSQDTVLLTADVLPANFTGGSYTWLADGVEIGQTNQPTFTYVLPNIDLTETNGRDINFEVIVTSPEGCIRSDNAIVNVMPLDYRIPNLFTPDNNDRNDVFRVTFKRNFQVKEMKVFNRWGQMVYEGKGQNAAWDGNYKGKPAPSDVYVYKVILTLGDKEYEEKGDVTLIR